MTVSDWYQSHLNMSSRIKDIIKKENMTEGWRGCRNSAAKKEAIRSSEDTQKHNSIKTSFPFSCLCDKVFSKINRFFGMWQGHPMHTSVSSSLQPLGYQLYALAPMSLQPP